MRYWMERGRWFVACECGWIGEADTKFLATQLHRGHRHDVTGTSA